MTYSDYMVAARCCSSFAEADALIKAAGDDESLSARRYFNIKHIALESAYEAEIEEVTK